jgi:hypothetical protein
MPIDALSVFLLGSSWTPGKTDFGDIQVALVGAVIVGHGKFRASISSFHVRLQVFDENFSRHGWVSPSLSSKLLDNLFQFFQPVVNFLH